MFQTDKQQSNKIVIDTQQILQKAKLTGQIPLLIEGIIAQKIIEKTAAELKITLTDEELQIAADRFRVEENLSSASKTWDWLKYHQLSVDDFEDMIANELLTKKLALHLFGNKIEENFIQNQFNYTLAVMYEVIFEDADLAEEVFYAISEGEMTFSDVASQYIEDLELRRRGGYLGTISRQELKPEISAAVFAAKTPQLLKPITTSKGIHLIFVEEIIKPQLTNDISEEILQNLFKEWLSNKIQMIKDVEIKLD